MNIFKIIDIIHKSFVIQGEKGSQGNTGNAGKNGEKVSENCCFDAHNLNVLAEKQLTFSCYTTEYFVVSALPTLCTAFS